MTTLLNLQRDSKSMKLSEWHDAEQRESDFYPHYKEPQACSICFQDNGMMLQAM